MKHIFDKTYLKLKLWALLALGGAGFLLLLHSAQQDINLGTTPNDGTGDTLRAAFVKVQANFSDLYTNAIINDTFTVTNAAPDPDEKLFSIFSSTNENFYIDEDGDFFFGSSPCKIFENSGEMWFNIGGANIARITTTWIGGKDNGVAGLRMATDAAATPGFTWKNDENTGMYWPEADTIGWSAGGTNYVTLDPDGDLFNVNHPNPSSNQVLLEVNNNGTYRFRVDEDGDAIFFGDLWVGDGDAAGPSYAFRTDSDNGFYLYDTDEIGVATAGIAAWHFDADGDFNPEGDGFENIGASDNNVSTVFAKGLNVYNSRLILNTSGTTVQYKDHSSIGDGHDFWHLNESALLIGNDTNKVVEVKTRLSLSSPSELTLSSDAITVTKSYHTVDGESDAADDIDTISGGYDGMILTLRAEHTDRTITVKDGVDNIDSAGDFALDSTEDTIQLIYDSTLTKWLELSRSDNN